MKKVNKQSNLKHLHMYILRPVLFLQKEQIGNLENLESFSTSLEQSRIKFEGDLWTKKLTEKVVCGLTLLQRACKGENQGKSKFLLSSVSPVFHTEATVSIVLKNVLRVGTSILQY